VGIKCPKCQTDNPDTQKFYGECATRLLSSKEIPVTETLETPAEELTAGFTFAGRYQIVEELGKGGKGRVYRVKDEKLDEERIGRKSQGFYMAFKMGNFLDSHTSDLWCPVFLKEVK